LVLTTKFWLKSGDSIVNEVCFWRLIQKVLGGNVCLEKGRKAAGQKAKNEQKNAGLKVVTLIATLNPVSQVLW